MTDPTPLEIAAALRSAAEFVRDPDSSKCTECEARDAAGKRCQPIAPEAVSWCAYGHFCRALGIESSGHSATWGDLKLLWDAASLFDDGEYEACARQIEAAADHYEASIPTHPATQREAVQA